MGLALEARAQSSKAVPLSTGRFLTPEGESVAVGSFPVNIVLSPDGRYLAVTCMGRREGISILSAHDGKVISRVEVNKKRTDGSKKKEGLYFGLALAQETDGDAILYASRGAEDRVAVHRLSREGKLAEADRFLDDPSGIPNFEAPHNVAGIALSGDGKRLYCVNNNASAHTGMKSSLSVADVAGNKILRKIELPGFPLDLAVLSKEGGADRIYIACERDGLVAVVDPEGGNVVATIMVGAQPDRLLLDRSQNRLFVSNGGGDSVSVIDTIKNVVTDSILVRPDDARGLAGTTPLGMAVSHDGHKLYVALADLNAVGVVDLESRALSGMIPTGWYPTCVALDSEGGHLFVANAKGVQTSNPNKETQGPEGAWGRYILDLLEGTVSRIALPDDQALKEMTKHVIANGFGRTKFGEPQIKNPGIEHVFYVIKENRTYDQVLGDMPEGNGDASLCLFPEEVTPNLHSLARRFVLLDNFYVCAEVSADGWNWSTSGMISPYTMRNTVYNYSDRGRRYDFEGQNNGVPVDLRGIPDVATAASGYIWDHCLKHGIEFRNYGFFNAFTEEDFVPNIKDPEGKPIVKFNQPTKKALVSRTDSDFLLFDMTYADSDAWVKRDAPAPRQRKTWGEHQDPSRIAAFRREFKEFVKNGNLPKFVMVRLCCDHTHGTTVGSHSPRAMVADNDYAVGQLVEMISRSPYWEKSAIFILEDDAQDGYDHVDAHRSIAFAISPFIPKGSVDHRFYNTDGMLRAMEELLGLPPMNQFDAVAPSLAVFGDQPANNAPYDPILPSRAIISEVNTKTAYGAERSEQFDFARADAIPDSDLNEIIWRSIRGADAPLPPVRYGLRLSADARGDD